MSRDVDEEGWEYSLQFTGGFSWHGNHPWFHSFVRRRRWLRLRKRRDTHRHTKEKAHELTAEYFTIHPKTLWPASEDLTSRANSSDMDRLRQKLEEELEDPEKMDITDIGSLIRLLKRASVDREKLVAVREFADEGGEEVCYLSERMPEIMSLFVYQSSRRQLLADLLHRFDEVHKRKDDLKEHQYEDENTQEEHDTATRRAENLMSAVHAADEQVKRLEYWSDIKSMAQGGETLQASEGGHWDTSKWQGLTSPTSADAEHPEEAFKSKQAAGEGAHELHSHPEHTPGEAEGSKAASKKSSIWFDTKESSEDTGTAYSTAAESASELSRKKGKGRAPSGLDGIDEASASKDEEDFVEAPETNAPTGAASALASFPGHRTETKNVQIVEPRPLEESPSQGANPEPGGARGIGGAAGVS